MTRKSKHKIYDFRCDSAWLGLPKWELPCWVSAQSISLAPEFWSAEHSSNLWSMWSVMIIRYCSKIHKTKFQLASLKSFRHRTQDFGVSFEDWLKTWSRLKVYGPWSWKAGAELRAAVERSLFDAKNTVLVIIYGIVSMIFETDYHTTEHRLLAYRWSSLACGVSHLWNLYLWFIC